MEKDKVSIITPMYNAQKFIAKAIESVRSQTYQNWEMLIINDKSKDKSFEIANEFAKKDDRIKIVNVIIKYSDSQPSTTIVITVLF